MIQLTNAVERYKKIILDELFENGIYCWIAGGAIRDYFMGTKIKTDYDLFFPNEEQYEKAKKHFINNNAAIKWESDNGMKFSYKGRTYDLIKHYFTGAQETIDNFDFTVSMFAVDRDKVYYGETSFIDLAKRQLMINKITYPASTMSRAFRYHKKGFSICLGEQKKLFLAIKEFELPQQQQQETGEQPAEPTSGDLADFFIGID
jgi:hypothetical protein